VEDERIIEKQELKNGITLILFDRSRVTAGDRWLVELKCEAHIQTEDGFWNMVAEEDSILQTEIRKILGDGLVFETVNKRNFIDASEREIVLQEMVKQFYSTILEYLKRPHFPQEFFKKRYRETHRKLLLQQAMNRGTDTC
jgi:predicted N-acyltransferase